MGMNVHIPPPLPFRQRHQAGYFFSAEVPSACPCCSLSNSIFIQSHSGGLMERLLNMAGLILILSQPRQSKWAWLHIARLSTTISATGIMKKLSGLVSYILISSQFLFIDMAFHYKVRVYSENSRMPSRPMPTTLLTFTSS